MPGRGKARRETGGQGPENERPGGGMVEDGGCGRTGGGSRPEHPPPPPTPPPGTTGCGRGGPGRSGAPYNGDMTGGQPEWVIREDAAVPVLVALYLRQVIGVRAPDELPALRGVLGSPQPPRPGQEQSRLEREWREYWAMTVEPLAHLSPVPLELVDGFDDLVALPTGRAEALRTAIMPHAANALDFARRTNERYTGDRSARPGVSYRAYASAIAEHERRVGRRAHSFELNVQVLPLAQRGVWWIGSLTVAVTDGLRSDVVAFDTAIHPIIADLA